MNKNEAPRTIFEALRRLLLCNKTQLAARLDVDPATLRRWERTGIDTNAAALNKVSALLIETLRAAGNADLLTQGYLFQQNGKGLRVPTLAGLSR